MTLFRAARDVIAQLWFALDTASALRHGKPVSERARMYCMNNTAPGRPEASGVAA
ncbi:hypothetical protein [Dietzia lutea]|uniref:hypothetical protein n=1 Tax=Dietzia lutea TaxID=546160 RepID=UPI001330C9B3|nr:hypothetical protein [Dietzia lutea]